MNTKRPKPEPVHQHTLFDFDKPGGAVTPPSQQIVRPFEIPDIFLGTSSFTATGWQGTFYPSGMRSRDFLAYYATQFRAVEIDSTFYGTPSAATVTGWKEKTPSDFVFAAKIPQVITHEKVLVNCEAEFDEFIGRMLLVEHKLGPLLLQFPKFDKWTVSFEGFLARLDTFFKRMPNAGCQFAIEIRNKNWLDERFLDALRNHNVALALTDTSFMPRPWEMKKPMNLVTADFAYVRWLGDRKGIEKQTTSWDKTVVDRRSDLEKWVELLRSLVLDKRLRRIVAFANNHYAGHAPDTVKSFWQLWNERR